MDGIKMEDESEVLELWSKGQIPLKNGTYEDVS